MDGVGTRQGYIHDQRQGTGLATVLSGGDLAAKTAMSFAEADMLERKKKKADADAAAAAALTEMQKFDPEMWYNHDAEIKGQVNDWHDKGTQLLQAGIDPMKSLSPEAVEWRKQQGRIKAMSRYSMQRKQEFDITRNKLDGTQANKYTSESIAAVKEYFDKPLAQSVDDQSLPPQLIERTPYVNRTDTWGKITAEWNKQNPGVDLPDDEVDTRAKAILNEPELGPQLQRSYDSSLALMPETERQAIKDRADEAGRSVYQQMAFEDAKRTMINRAPFNMAEFEKKGVDSINPSTYSTAGPLGSSSGVDMKKLKAQADIVASSIIESDPRALKAYDKPGLLPRDGDNDEEYKARLRPYLAKRLVDMTEQSRATAQTEKGKEAKEIKESGQLWLKHMMSPDRQYYNEAGTYLYMMKGVVGNMNVTDVKVNESMRDGKPYRELELRVEGAPELKKANQNEGLIPGSAEEQAAEEKAIQESLNQMGIKGDYQQLGTERVVKVPITIENENQLLQLYQMRYNQQKQPYTGAYTLPGYQYPQGNQTNPVTPPPGNWLK